MFKGSARDLLEYTTHTRVRYPLPRSKKKKKGNIPVNLHSKNLQSSLPNKQSSRKDLWKISQNNFYKTAFVKVLKKNKNKKWIITSEFDNWIWIEFDSQKASVKKKEKKRSEMWWKIKIQ